MYLVTGGAGFIGSHLCEALLARGASVRILDDFSTGKRANVPHGVDVIVGDVADRDLVRHAVVGISGCFHLAAIASVQRGLTDWLGTHRTNLTGAITLLDAVSRLPERPPIVYASSAAVYGDTVPPIAEEAPKRPLSAYGADKYACESHAGVASHVHGVPTTGLRFFNVYGPRQDPKSPYSGVISIFCHQLLQGLPIDVYGDGEQTRDFIFVKDVVVAMIAAMDYPGDAAIYNVCTGLSTSVLRLADVIAGLLRTKLNIQHRAPRAGDIRHSTGSPAQLRQALNLPDPVPLQAGLTHVIDWLVTGNENLTPGRQHEADRPHKLVPRCDGGTSESWHG
jgi:UDP-glucose 4-epimerase